jgi:hypothetical protein
MLMASSRTANSQILQNFYDQHAISTKVGEVRHYIRYEQSDPERIVRKAWPNNPRFAGMIAGQCGGIVIPRYAPSFMRLPPVPAELRPDEKVRTGSHWHYHGAERHGESLSIPTSGKSLPARFVHSPVQMARHIAKVHGGINTNAVHLDEHRAKYVFPPGDGAKRIDVHPDAWPRFRGAQRVFFVIEGCIKADAVLSAGEAVFSVPSVTLWRAPELAELAPRLRGSVVYIVPDSDWHENGAVLAQAMFCRTFLRRAGVDAHVAAPPAGSDGSKIGIDDHLVHGGTMGELDVLDRQTHYGLAEFIAEQGQWRKDKVIRGAEVLENLAIHADSNGRLHTSLRSIARIMGVHHSRVERAIRDLEECGAIYIDGSLTIQPRHYDRRKACWVGWEWAERPAITITPLLRAKDHKRKLGA